MYKPNGESIRRGKAITMKMIHDDNDNDINASETRPRPLNIHADDDVVVNASKSLETSRYAFFIQGIGLVVGNNCINLL
jgi:hypothetical protein